MYKETFDNIIADMQAVKDIRNNSLTMDSIIVSDINNKYQYYFIEEKELHEIRSISKLIVALCYGILICDMQAKYKEEQINLDTKIWSIIKDKVTIENKDNISKLQKVTLRHLFTHTTGYDKQLLFQADIKDISPATFLHFLCNEPLLYEPGEHFLYSNASAFLLSVIFQEITGQNLSHFANDKIFSKLEITNFFWKDYGNYCAGATGLYLFNNDLHKIGKLLIQQGIWNGLQVIPPEWIRKMTTPQHMIVKEYNTVEAFPRSAYGLFLWICKNGDYFIQGNGGQYLLVSPQKNIVLTALGHVGDTQIVSRYLKLLLE
ncbi:MAG: beta-lactamase family protein [Tannerella sp.]|nr:beta-lactamase family protein [Tannerella sp.]